MSNIIIGKLFPDSIFTFFSFLRDSSSFGFNSCQNTATNYWSVDLLENPHMPILIYDEDTQYTKRTLICCTHFYGNNIKRLDTDVVIFNSFAVPIINQNTFDLLSLSMGLNVFEHISFNVLPYTIYEFSRPILGDEVYYRLKVYNSG